MANQIQATVYQIDGNPIISPIQLNPISISFLTSDIMFRELSLREIDDLKITQVKSALVYYKIVNNKLQVQYFYVSETVDDLFTAANSGGATQLKGTVLAIDENIQRPNGVKYCFPVNNISIWASTDTLLGANSFIQYKEKKYRVSENLATLVSNSNTPLLNSATFFDSTTQNNGGATTANQVLIGSTQQAVGFTLSNNAITVVNAGTYFVSANLQLAFTGGASNYNVTFWYTIDNAIVDNSAFTFTTTGAQYDQTLATITDTLTVTAGQSLRFYWWSQATGMKLLATAAGSNPTRPLSPSVNINLFNVG
jgi:hypothetical protein